MFVAVYVVSRKIPLAHWTFLSNHAHVLFLICGHPDMRMRDIASQVGITERAVQRIVHDLVDEGYLDVEKRGRRNHYTPILDAHLRHPLEEQITIGDMLHAMTHRSDTAS